MEQLYAPKRWHKSHKTINQVDVQQQPQHYEDDEDEQDNDSDNPEDAKITVPEFPAIAISQLFINSCGTTRRTVEDRRVANWEICQVGGCGNLDRVGKFLALEE